MDLMEGMCVCGQGGGCGDSSPVPSHGCQLAQHHPELLRAIGKVLDTLHHVLRGSGRRVVEGSCLGGHHDLFEHLTEEVAVVHHLVLDVLGLGLAGQGIPNEDKLVGAEDDELAVGHKDLGRLVGADSSEEGVNGVGERGEVGLALLQVEEEQLAVSRTQGTPCWAIVLGRAPVGQVVVNGACYLLLQPLKLLQLWEG